jgi:CheY-like chemotaxis protein/HPt (histidine-containing phosphotransfer) domain-containing protein
MVAMTPGHVLGDVTRLRQVLINLLGNAVKFTSAGKVELRLAQTEAGDFVRLEVVDTGPGIWSRHRNKLFQTFERLNTKAVAAIEGSGVGLALAAQLVRAMDGRIGYEDNPGGGSVFWVELPASRANPITADVTATVDRATTPGRRLLVVDDDALNRDIATRFLTLGGHQVVCLDSGPAAVAAAKSEDFDVILMDVRMPGMNGLEATRLIRMLGGPRGRVPVIALTAQAFTEQIEICRRAGMNTHVSKPFTQAVILAAVDAMVAARQVAPMAVPPTATEEPGPEIPLFDHAAFEDVTGCLSPADASEHLGNLIARGEALLCSLRTSEVLANAGELAEAAHKLAGGAAMLGFLSLAHIGRRFERAADSGAADTPVLAKQLAAAVATALTIMRQELAGMAAAAL